MFEVPKVVDIEEGERTIADLLKSAQTAAPVRTALADQIASLLTDRPQKLADLARAIGRKPQDGSVRNALNQLHEERRAKYVEKGWVQT
jgi:hypothetical protein